MAVDAPTLVGPTTEEVRQTHISWVFLGASEVYKLKKPVDLGFVDFTTLALRKAACDAEVALNSRLAPSVYLGVVPLRADAEGRLHPTDEKDADEWAVHMRRLPDEARADLAVDVLSIEQIDRLAERLVAFHANSRCDEHTRRFGTPEAIAHNVQENFAQAGDCPSHVIGLDDTLEIEAWHLDFIRTHRSLLEERVAQGHVRDGHGDLRLEHVYFVDGEPLVIDCIEFNERFRFADVCADIAFLSMDLARLGRHDLAERLLARYAQDSGDYALYGLVDFYESYRAFVRGKIACFQLGEVERPALQAEARAYFMTALAAKRPALVAPAVVAVGGIIASGKSTVADRLAYDLGGAVVEADRTRKQLMGLAASDHSAADDAWRGAYAPDFTERVYDELARRARLVVESGRSVVLDASFRAPGLRARPRQLAERLGVPFWFVECTADADVCRERLRKRDPASTASDAREDIFDAFLARYQPPDEVPEDRLIRVDTARPREEIAAQLRRRILHGEPQS